MKFNVSPAARYRFEQFIAKGGLSIFYSLLALFVSLFIFIVVLRAFILLFLEGYDGYDGFSTHIWAIFLQMTDPGNMNFDTGSSTSLKMITILAGMTGVVIFSMLIAFITTGLEQVLYQFRKGRGPVVEEGHTLILGWNDRAIDILSELILANESENKASAVILSQSEKEKMDDKIIKQIKDTKTTKIVTTSGSPAVISELQRVNAGKAKSVIILSSCSDSAPEKEKELSDIQIIKCIVALIAAQDGKNKIPVIAEMFSEEKRELLTYFRAEGILAVNSWQTLGKLLFQTSLTSGLIMVYNEILSFAGNEIYFQAIGEKELSVPFGQLIYHFKDGIPMGIARSDGTVFLRPPADTFLKKDEELLILANDDSSVSFKPEPVCRPAEIIPCRRKLEKTTKNILILGWHEIGEIFVQEAASYLPEGSTVDVVYRDLSGNTLNKIVEIGKNIKLKFSYRDEDPTRLKVLENCRPYDYDTILILSQNVEEESAEKIDADTLLLLFMLRRVAEDNRLPTENTILITQILNSQNSNLISQTDVDDFIISNKFITMFLAQLSEQPRIKNLYDDIFKESGSEIYVKPAGLYFDDFDRPLRFAELMAAAGGRSEVCLGMRRNNERHDSSKNFGIRLNIPKTEIVRIGPEDFLVVLAADEL